MKPLISIVVPVFKVESYLQRCIDSIIKQSYINLEILIIDDGSPDNCPSICDYYQIKDNRIKVIHQENKGLSGARNAGTRVATGEFITYVDSDDYIQPLYVEQLYTTLLCSGKRISACSYSYSKTELSNVIHTDYVVFDGHDAIKEVLSEKTIQPSAWGKLYDIELAKTILFPEGKLFEDYATTPLLLDLGDGIAYVDNKLYFYTYNKESITKSKFNHKQMQYFDVAESINCFLSDKYPDLEDMAICRDVNVAISYYRKMLKDGYYDECDIRLITNKIRRNLKRFMTSSYPTTKKIAAVGIAIFPKRNEKVFKR